MKDWFTKAKTFLAETRTELKKVTFPNRDEVVGTTVVVIITSVIFAVFLWAADAVILWLYQGLNKILGA
ncbi:MAG: preprotein translocase subunit SecE [Acidobacteria bacterium]|nr:MAG: preprotein translocase subunit SecE [Acidobacteriota bacterium]REK07150.1 MAG: preprotein translocase subunit SecE [Acidobacteriota bacterium]